MVGDSMNIGASPVQYSSPCIAFISMKVCRAPVWRLRQCQCYDTAIHTLNMVQFNVGHCTTHFICADCCVLYVSSQVIPRVNHLDFVSLALLSLVWLLSACAWHKYLLKPRFVRALNESHTWGLSVSASSLCASLWLLLADEIHSILISTRNLYSFNPPKKQCRIWEPRPVIYLFGLSRFIL